MARFSPPVDASSCWSAVPRRSASCSRSSAMVRPEITRAEKAMSRMNRMTAATEENSTASGYPTAQPSIPPASSSGAMPSDRDREGLPEVTWMMPVTPASTPSVPTLMRAWTVPRRRTRSMAMPSAPSRRGTTIPRTPTGPAAIWCSTPPATPETPNHSRRPVTTARARTTNAHPVRR